MKVTSLVCAVVLGLVCVAPNHLLSGKEPEFRLDHFKVYRVTAAQDVEDRVALKGQFDRDYRRVKISGPQYFSNPVSKNGEDVLDKNAHLNWYKLEGEEEPQRAVRFRNQFGEQSMVIGPAALLAVPTKKAHDNDTFPLSERLDHFKFYRVVEGKSLEKEVTLADQFGKEKNIVIRPVGFCLPVSKTHDRSTTKIVNERDHLVVYLLKRQEHEVKFETSDQFGTNTLKTSHCAWLCVPSEKTAFEEVKAP